MWSFSFSRTWLAALILALPLFLAAPAFRQEAPQQEYFKTVRITVQSANCSLNTFGLEWWADVGEGYWSGTGELASGTCVIMIELATRFSDPPIGRISTSNINAQGGIIKTK